jgi:hypothetical protein
MERIQSELERKKTDIFSNAAHRMPKRPFPIQSGKGRGHEDFGSSFAPSQPVQGKATGGSKFKPAASRPIVTNLKQDSPSDSDDELLLSEGAQPSGLSPIHKRVVGRGKAAVSMPQEDNLAPNGHPYHQDYRPRVLPKFTRIKKESRVEESILDLPPSSSFPDADISQELFRPISDDLASQTMPFRPATKPKKEIVTAFARPGPGKNSMSRKTVTPSSTTEDELTKRVSKLRAVKAGRSISRGQSPEATPRASRQPQPFPLDSHSSVYDGSSRASDASPPWKSTREHSAAKKENADIPTRKPKEKANARLTKSTTPFPMNPQLKGEVDALLRKPATPFPMSPPGKSNLPTLPEPTGPKPFPLSSYTPKPGLARSETLGSFPAPSPLTSPVQPPSRDKGKRRVLTPHQDEDVSINRYDTVRTNVAPRPFPVGLGEIKTAPRRSPQSSSESMRSKRASDDGDGERRRKSKKHKEDNSR